MLIFIADCSRGKVPTSNLTQVWGNITHPNTEKRWFICYSEGNHIPLNFYGFSFRMGFFLTELPPFQCVCIQTMTRILFYFRKEWCWTNHSPVEGLDDKRCGRLSSKWSDCVPQKLSTRKYEETKMTTPNNNNSIYSDVFHSAELTIRIIHHDVGQREFSL